VRQTYRMLFPPTDPNALPEYLRGELSRIDNALAGLDPQTTTKWRQMDSQIMEGSAVPTKATTHGNIETYQFSASDGLNISTAIAKDYAEGTTLKPYVRWTVTGTASATNNAVVWDFEYTLANVSATYGATQTLSVTATAGEINQLRQTSLGSITASAATINSVMLGRLTRSGGNYTARATFVNFTVEYEADDIGSGTETHKRI